MGAPRDVKPKGPTQTLALKLDKELYERLKALADEEERPVPGQARILIREGLDSRERPSRATPAAQTNSGTSPAAGQPPAPSTVRKIP